MNLWHVNLVHFNLIVADSIWLSGKSVSEYKGLSLNVRF